MTQPETNHESLGSIDFCRIVDFPKIADPRGNLTFIEGQRHISFDIRRIYPRLSTLPSLTTHHLGHAIWSWNSNGAR